MIEAAVTVLSAVPGHRLSRTLLNKALFYADLFALLDLGHTITPGKYVALKNGPVVSGYPKTLLGRLEKADVAHVSDMAVEDGSLPVTLLKESPHPHLTAEEVAILERVAREAAKHCATDWSEYSHENPGWLLAWETGAGAGQGVRVINMNIAVQQIADRDPWLTRPVDEPLRDAFSVAESDDTTRWE